MMKKLIRILYFLFLFSLTTFPENKNINLVFKAEMLKNNGSDRLTLIKDSPLENIIEGYFYLPQHESQIKGEMKKGGFSFLDPNVFDVAFGLKKLRKEWVKNDFPVTDLGGLTNGVNLEKIFSFYIIPEMRNPGDKYITLFFKYAVFNRLDPETDLEPNQSYNIRLFSKKLKFLFGKDTSFSFIDSEFKGYHFTFSIQKEENYVQNLNLKNTDKFFEAVKKSSDGSLLLEGVIINLSSEFLQFNNDDNVNKRDLAEYSGLKLRAGQSPLLKVKRILDVNTKKELDLASPVYAGKLSFPFRIYNSLKEKEYSSYKESSRLFKSVYNIVAVPISYHSDSLTIDLFLDYSKISIDDIPRWTPIKKRIILVKNYPVRIDLPKENWTANFIRNGDKYDIYGYSDFERYVNEFLIISFNSIEKE